MILSAFFQSFGHHLAQEVRTAITSSWLNVLLIVLVVGWIVHFLQAVRGNSIPDVAVFICNFIGLIPLAALMSWKTEQMEDWLGGVGAGLLNAAFGNAVELIVAIIALAQCQIEVVQASLIGSILSNLLLVLGMCFFAGGLRFSEQGFQVTSSQLNSEMLMLTAVTILVPSIYHASVYALSATLGVDAAEDWKSTASSGILAVSRAIAIVLFILYALHMYFQLGSHAKLVNAQSPASEPYGPEVPRPITAIASGVHSVGATLHRRLSSVRGRRTPDEEEGENPVIVLQDLSSSPEREVKGPRILPESPGVETPVIEQETIEVASTPPEQETPVPKMKRFMDILMLAVLTVLVGISSEFLVDSINGVTASGAISKQFIGLILLPIVGNAVEHVTAVTVAWKDKLDMSIAVAVGSAIQISHLVIPLMVIIAWPWGKELSMLFDPVLAVVLLFTVLLVNYTMADAKSNWMEGMLLMLFYVILAVTFWYHPGYNAASSIGITCH